MMSYGMTASLVDSHLREIRRQAAQCRICAYHRGSRRSRGQDRWAQLRNRIGFALVEAGLRLLTTTRPAPRN
jgi:hypothetical protein